MDINQNLEQINTFEKGMNTDTSDALLPSNQYRYAENLRFTSHDTNNSGELQQIRDLRNIFEFEDEIIATSRIRNYGIFITKNEKSWSIFTVELKTLKKQLIFGPCTESIGDTISLVTRWETDKDAKLYIADGKHPLMLINILHEDYDVDGKAPTEIEYIYTQSKVILKQADVEISSKKGSVKPAVIQYTYRLYKEGGSASEYAPLSKLIYITKTDTEGYAKEDTSDKSIDINIDINETNGLDKIQLIRITYAQSGQQPDIQIIYDDEIKTFLKNSKFTYNDDGSSVGSIASYEFLQSETFDKIKPRVIESKGDYLFAANILDYQDEIENQWKDIDFTKVVTITQIQDSNHEYKLDVCGNIKDNGKIYPSLRAGETYRYGIILYDYKGRKSTVKWVCDLTVDLNTKVISLESDGYRISPIGIRVLAERIKNCSKYEIVRCLRGVDQTKVLYQGICGFALGCNNNAFANIFLSDTNVRVTSRESLNLGEKPYTTKYDLLEFACPENVYLPEETENVLKNRNISIKTNIKYNIDIDYYKNDSSVLLEDDFVYARQAFCVGKCNKLEGVLKHSINTGVDFEFFLTPDYRGVTYYWGFPLESYTKIGNFYDFNECTIKSFLCYLYPSTVSKFDNSTINISDHIITDSFKPQNRAFSDTDDVNDVLFVGADNYSYTVGKYTYKNWYMDKFQKQDGDFVLSDFEHAESTKNVITMAPAGKSIIFELDGEDSKGFDVNTLFNYNYSLDKYRATINTNVNYNNMFRIDVRDIINNDYVGYPYDKTLSSFYSFGNIYDNGTYNTIYDGDTYVNVFIYNNTHIFEQPYFHLISANVVYAVPIQSSINLLHTYGLLITNIDNEYAYMYQDYAGRVYGYQQNKDAYLYNAAYSATSNLIAYNVIRHPNTYSKLFDTRIKVSEQKTNGEIIDSWPHFKSSSTLDVDTRFGEITHMRLFKDWLIFWLESATGVLSVNERVLVLDADDTSILLGTGGVLQRYDYLSVLYGMLRNNIAETHSNTTLYWWDSRKREILGYSGGLLTLPMTEIKNIRSYINRHDNITKPCIVYSLPHNEVIMNVVYNYPLVYNELIQQFTSVYDYAFHNAILFDDDIWTVLNNDVWDLKGSYMKGLLSYVVNKNSTYVKVFDNVRFGVNLVSNSYSIYNTFSLHDEKNINLLQFRFKTPELYSELGVNITNREYDYRFAIPRAQIRNKEYKWEEPLYGQRMRGKYMVSELTIPEYSNKNATSLLYIITKFRISYS